MNCLVLFLQIVSIGGNNIREMISLGNIQKHTINILLVTICCGLKFQIKVARSEDVFHLLTPSNNFFIQCLVLRLSISQQLSGQRAAKTGGSSNNMTAILGNNIKQVLVISRNSTHTTRHIATAPCSCRDFTDLSMPFCRAS